METNDHLWTQEVPDVMWKERRLLFLSFAIFMISVLIGIVSTLGDESFPRLILGDGTWIRRSRT